MLDILECKLTAKVTSCIFNELRKGKCKEVAKRGQL